MMKLENLASSVVMLIVCTLWLGLSASSAEAAQTVHLTLEVEGTVIDGESTITSLNRADTIECYSFGQNGYTSIDAATGLAIGRRQHRPITITKGVDKSSPLLWKAWSNNERVTSAAFRFYRPVAAGTGAEEHFLTILLRGGAIVGMSVGSQNTLVGGTNAPPVMESVTFTFDTITWTYETGGVEHTDGWGSPL